MAAQHAVQFCAQSLDSAATLGIEEMGPKFDRDAMQRVKGMTEKQKLALRIDLGPLDTFPVPGSTNLHAAMVRLDIQVIRHPYGFACCVIENSKRKPSALRLRGEPPIDEISQFVGRRNGRVPQLPKLAILQCFGKVIRMATIEGYQAGSGAS
jgi:hypothetical protein